MPRLLHTADWQIGRQYARFDAEDAAALSEARFAAVERIAALASAEAVDAVLVAGDIFDAQTLSERSLRRLFNALAAYSGPWIMLPGNHDAALADSVWTRAQRLDAIPANVVLALEPVPLEFAAAGFVVLPAPLTQRQTHHDLSSWFDSAASPPGLARIGLAHGSVSGVLAAGIDAGNPIAADRVERAQLDYLALGDWHGTRQLNPRCWYSGTPEPDRFKDNDPGNVLLVDLPAAGALPTVSKRPIAAHRWVELTRALNVASDLDQLAAELAALPAGAVIALSLSGSLDLAQQAQLERSLAVTAARARSLEVERSALQLELSTADYADLQADGYVAEVIDILRAQAAAAEAQPSQCARDALGLLAGLLQQQEAG